MEAKDMKELSDQDLEMVSGGTEEQAVAYLQTMYEKYGATDFKELWVQMTLEEQSRYEMLYRYNP